MCLQSMTILQVTKTCLKLRKIYACVCVEYFNERRHKMLMDDFKFDVDIFILSYSFCQTTLQFLWQFVT